MLFVRFRPRVFASFISILCLGSLPAPSVRAQSDNDKPWQGQYYGYLGVPASGMWNFYTPCFRIKIMRTGTLTHLGFLMRWDSPTGDSGTHSGGNPPWRSRFEIFLPNASDSGPGQLLTRHDHTFTSHSALGSDKRGGFYMVPLSSATQVKFGDSLWLRHTPLDSAKRVSVNFGARTAGYTNFYPGVSGKNKKWGAFFGDKPVLLGVGERPIFPVWKEKYSDGVIAGQKYWGNSGNNRVELKGGVRFRQSWWQDTAFVGSGEIELWLWKLSTALPTGNLSAALRQVGGSNLKTWTIRPSDVAGPYVPTPSPGSGTTDDLLKVANEPGNLVLNPGTQYEFEIWGPSSGPGFWTCPMDNWNLMKEPAYAGDVPGGFPTVRLVKSTNGGSSWDAKMPYANSVFPVKFRKSSAGLPPPQDTSDVGDIGTPGGTDYSDNPSINIGSASGSSTYTSGTYVLKGAGAGIGGQSDGFRFMYQTANGDCSIVARVASVDGPNGTARGGVMIREMLDGKAKSTSLAMTESTGLAFQRRWNFGGATTTYITSSVSAPYWVRLTRRGNVFAAERSLDGIAWRNIGQSTIGMTSYVYIGLAVSSHDAAKTCTATFTDVSITP